MADADPDIRLPDRLAIGPRFTVADAAALNARFDGVSTQEMLATALGEGLLGRVAAVSSFGAESAVLLHLIAAADPSVPVLFLETGKHFPETLAYRDLLAAKDATGLRWSYDPVGCCDLRKVEPLARGLIGFDASFTGRKAFQSKTRTALPRFELDTSDTVGRLKVNPLITWMPADIDAYFAAHDLPRHPLVEHGFPSIGCQPCTNRVTPGQDPRSGRWSGWDKVECGIHKPLPDGDPNLPSF